MGSLLPSTWLAVASWVGAFLALPLPPVAGLGLLALGVASRRHVVMAVGALVLATALAAGSAGGSGAAPRGSYAGEVLLVGDPRPHGPALAVDLRLGGQRVEAWARGREAAALRHRLAGERVVLEGQLSPAPPDAPWLARRHVVGRMTVTSVGGWRPGDPASRAANGLRRTLVTGAESMSREHRSLYAGLLLGDQREQGPVVADAFRGSGLTHLLAVSGQNVAFVLALVGPVLVRLRLGWRLILTVAVLGFFALVTRFEPSVLRATTMAGLGAIAVTFGLEADSRRLLGLACTLLILLDPLIIHHLAFQLSVAATAGILLWGGRIAAALPGPRPICAAIAVTVSAQAAVSPLLVPLFGGMPVASLLANVLAAPATGPVVVWGIPAGLVAGLTGGWVAGLLHLPTRLLIGWIGGVAERCATLPLGEVRTPHLVVAGAGAASVWLGRSSRRRAPLLLGVLLVSGALAHPALELAAVRTLAVEIDGSARLHLAGSASVLELDLGARPESVLAGLRRAGVARVDVVVARHGGRDVAEVVAALRSRSAPRLVLAPRGHRVPGGSVPRPGSVVSAGRLEVHVGAVAPLLEVEVLRADGARAAPV